MKNRKIKTAKDSACKMCRYLKVCHTRESKGNPANCFSRMILEKIERM